mgnify:CR=1 FL=1
MIHIILKKSSGRALVSFWPPMIRGCDAAGYDEDGREVVVHAVVSDPSWTGDETLDPRRSLLSERYQGTFADKVVVPRRNVVPKPASMSFEEAACLPTAWLTAYRMLFTRGGLKAGDTVLVQGAGGGVGLGEVGEGVPPVRPHGRRDGRHHRVARRGKPALLVHRARAVAAAKSAFNPVI